MNNIKIRKIFLEGLPRWENGKNKGSIDWKRAIGHKVHFIYWDIEGEIEIIDYFTKDRKILIKYKNIITKIDFYQFQKCGLGQLIGKRTKNFKFKIGSVLKNEKKDVIIINQKFIKGKKYYQYHCNKCGYECGECYKNGEHKEEYWVEESNLINYGCACCCNQSQIVVSGINDIATTDAWMLKYFKNKEDGSKYTYGINKKVKVICPDCRREKFISLNKLYINKSISCLCSDKISYPEKFTLLILEQLGIDFQIQLSKTNFDWCNKYRYDFYFVLNNKEYIIETHGKQHYEDAWEKLEKTQENDRLKKKLALDNGIKEENYIIIDCKESKLEWIKNSILNNETLYKLFDLNKINWLKAEEFACSNLVKIACEYKRNNPDMTTTEIGIIMGGYIKDTISKWLKIGHELKWCHYNSTEEYFKGVRKINKTGKQVEIFKDCKSLGVFRSASDLSRKSMDLFGVKLNFRNISAVCLGNEKTHKGYTFKFAN
jgi:hypothetical protein